MPRKGVDAWMRTLPGLQFFLVMENVAELVPIGTGDKNRSVPLIQEIIRNILKYIDPAQNMNEFSVFFG